MSGDFSAGGPRLNAYSHAEIREWVCEGCLCDGVCHVGLDGFAVCPEWKAAEARVKAGLTPLADGTDAA